MKYLVISVLVLMNLSIACNNTNFAEATQSSQSDSVLRDPITLAPIKMTDFDSCKYLHERIMYYVEQVDLKQLSKKEAKKKTDSLQKILYQLRSKININQRKELSDYASKLFNEMVDRKVVRDNK
jgi:hypothetical protein